MKLDIFTKNKTLILFMTCLVASMMFSESAFAAGTSGGGLPFDGWLTKVSNSITGPFAFSVSVIGLVTTGAQLIFGGEMSGFMKSLIYIVLVLSIVVAAKNTIQAVTGQGAEITLVENVRTI